MLVFKSPLVYFTMAPECKGSEAGSSDMPRRSCKALPLSERYVYIGKQYIESSVVSVVTGIHWGSWTVCPGEAGTTVGSVSGSLPAPPLAHLLEAQCIAWRVEY